MGLGRNEFLRLMTLALSGIVVDPSKAVVTNNNFYINKKLGVLFQKPSSWGFIHVKDFGKLKDQQILGNGWNELKEDVWRDLGDPICLATKYFDDKPEYKGIFSPTITLQVTPLTELADFGHESFEELIAMSEYGISQILKDFKVLKRHDPYFISGSKFYEFDSQYLFEHMEMNEPVLVELKTLKTEHNGFYYDFNCHQSISQNQIAHNEFEEFKQSIKLM